MPLAQLWQPSFVLDILSRGGSRLQNELNVHQGLILGAVKARLGVSGLGLLGWRCPKPPTPKPPTFSAPRFSIAADLNSEPWDPVAILGEFTHGARSAKRAG